MKKSVGELIFKDIDFDAFLSKGMETTMDCAKYCGYIYCGEVAFELTKTMEDDHLLNVSVMLTDEEVDNESFGENILFVDTTNNVNAVAEIGTIVIEIPENESAATLEDLLKNEVLNFINTFSEYDISNKLTVKTTCFYC